MVLEPNLAPNLHIPKNLLVNLMALGHLTYFSDYTSHGVNIETSDMNSLSN